MLLDDYKTPTTPQHFIGLIGQHHKPPAREGVYVGMLAASILPTFRRFSHILFPLSNALWSQNMLFVIVGIFIHSIAFYIALIAI